MATITEDYVSFETAKLLKEKGFDGECSIYYNIEEIKEMEENGDLEAPEPNEVDRESLMYDYTDIYIKAPTQAMAMKWLREVHYKHCCISYDIGLKWFFQIVDLKEIVEYDYPETKYYHAENETGFNTYEQACEAAIKYYIENLIK